MLKMSCHGKIGDIARKFIFLIALGAVFFSSGCHKCDNNQGEGGSGVSGKIDPGVTGPPQKNDDHLGAVSHPHPVP